MYVPQEIIELSKMRDEVLAATMKVFSTHGCVGFEKNSLYEETKDFLRENNVPFEAGKRLFIYSPQLSENLQKIFKSR